ncbi:hypothetical protein SRB5_50040 [Streptomyces sp. RB5]|uniref:Uncharacterized protein n=1 Tax=Streptomyces smaragdinus TaxID=2585196 RepID=A0A7K0CMW3_9ACTN|nr:hypothetical protein [Streptomyces smaragdinus]MQY14828.1 hypothetical protein [Streptomyces smaragdinus]
MNFFDIAADALSIAAVVALFAVPAVVGRWAEARTYRRAVEAARRARLRKAHTLAA